MNPQTIRAVVFDLDGTLLNTLDDICDALNFALTAHGFPPRSREEVRAYLGNGAKRLLECALPDSVPEETFLSLYHCYDAQYTAHRQDKTQPYPGVTEMLRALRANGLLTAVLSNKQDNVTRPLCTHYFPNLLDAATGPADGRRTKPEPDGLMYIAQLLRVRMDEIVYVGDSETDLLTGRNAHVPTIAVTWGFRDRAWLLENGAEYLAEKTEDIPKTLAQIMDKCAQM